MSRADRLEAIATFERRNRAVNVIFHQANNRFNDRYARADPVILPFYSKTCGIPAAMSTPAFRLESAIKSHFTASEDSRYYDRTP
ncbi:hypothetical protein [Sorlinia euscelidii]|uniref:hypothetical protein n=1 Tax=Sorlinia euscelidii TaxID=3081148 RepID=UPI00374E1197